MTEAHRYTPASIAGDAAKATVGLLACLLPLVLIEPMAWLQWILIGGVILFSLFALKTGLRAMTRLERDGNGLRQVGPGTASVVWTELQSLELRYYATRRDREKGWFQLQLASNNGKIALDSNINGFEGILTQAVAAADQCRLSLDTVTRDNLAALGIKRPGYTEE